jgi:hypothetical protein
MERKVRNMKIIKADMYCTTHAPPPPVLQKIKNSLKNKKNLPFYGGR